MERKPKKTRRGRVKIFQDVNLTVMETDINLWSNKHPDYQLVDVKYQAVKAGTGTTWHYALVLYNMEVEVE